MSATIYTYGSKTIHLIPFLCVINEGAIHLKEHKAYRWLKPDELLSIDWAAADIPIVKEVISRLCAV